MLVQSLKDVYFLLNRYACLPNTALARRRFRTPRNPEGHYLHLGCGDDYLEGLINVDGNFRRKCDAWLDLRNRLPFAGQSVRVIYCSHTLEHLIPNQALGLLREMHRVLSPDRVVRLAVPSFEHAMNILAGRMESHWPRDFQESCSQAINYLFCDGQHKYGYCLRLLRRFAQQAGFSRIVDYSVEHGVKPKSYGRVTLENVPPGVRWFLNCNVEDRTDRKPPCGPVSPTVR